MEFIEAPAFTRHVSKYLDDGGLSKLQIALAVNPEAGVLIPGTGGFRKLRWQDARRGKGTRGGLRVIYYYFLSDDQIWLMALYNKNEATDLTPSQKKTLKHTIESELRERAAKRTSVRSRRLQ